MHATVKLAKQLGAKHPQAFDSALTFTMGGVFYMLKDEGLRAGYTLRADGQLVWSAPAQMPPMTATALATSVAQTAWLTRRGLV
jgi:hypothetical protein